MLNELVRVGWLVRHPGRKTYHLGPRLVAVGQAAESSVDIIDFARPVLADLADDAGLAACVVVPSGDELLIGDIRQPLGQRVGTLGLRSGDLVTIKPPLGAVLVAWNKEATAVEHWIDRQTAAGRTASSRLRYLAVIDAVRARGYAVEEFPPAPRTLGEMAAELAASQNGHRRMERLVSMHEQVLYPEVAVAELNPAQEYWPISINAPVFDVQGHVIAALCVLDSAVAMTGERVEAIGVRVTRSAQELSQLIAGRTGPPR
jgi:DNA-binding IclR family transcriptional regulator